MGGSLIYEIRYENAGGSLIWHDISDDVISGQWKVGFDTPYQIMGHENTATIKLRNLDGNWLPEAAGTLYRTLMQTDNRFRVRGVTTQGTIVIWRGRVEEWDLDFGSDTGDKFNKPNAVITCYSNSVRLKRRTLDFPLLTDTSASIVIGSVVTLAGLIATDIDDSTQVIPYMGDGDLNAWNLLEEATKAEYGRTFISNRDRIEHWNRYYTIHRGTVTPDGTIISGQQDIDGGITGLKAVPGINYVHGALWHNVYRVSYQPRKSSGSAITVWELDTPMIFEPNQTQNFEVRFRQSDGQYVSCETVTAGSISWNYGSASISPTAYGGIGVVSVNNTNDWQAQLGSLQLSGTAIQRFNKVTYERDDSTTSLAKVWEIDLPITSYTQAQNIANWEAMRLGNRESLIYAVPMFNSLPDDAADHQMLWNIGTVVRVYISAVSHDRNYIIIGYEHQSIGTDKALYTVWYLEPVAQQYFDSSTGTQKTRDFAVYGKAVYGSSYYTH